jgi:hypothetical protein
VAVHLDPTPSGAANKDMRKHVDQIIKKVARTDPRISLNFVSVDGGEGYDNFRDHISIPGGFCQTSGVRNSILRFCSLSRTVLNR